MLGSIIKDSFKLTNKYIVLATPLILFSLLSSLYILFSTGGNALSLIIAICMFTLMFAAFLAGWFYMIKSCVQAPDRDDINALIKEFPAGVGEYFLTMIGFLLIVFVFSGFVLLVSHYIGVKFIGDVGISSTAYAGALANQEALKKFVLSLTQEQLTKLNAWSLLLFFTMGIEYFLMMFYIPSVFFKTKKPLKAFGIAIADLFRKKFFCNVLLYFLMFLTYSIISLITTVLGGNTIIHFIMTLVNFYFMVYVSVLVCNYYYNNYIKIGSEVDKTI